MDEDEKIKELETQIQNLKKAMPRASY